MTELRKETKAFEKNISSEQRNEIMIYQRNIENYESKRTTSPMGFCSALIFRNNGRVLVMSFSCIILNIEEVSV